MSSQELSLKKQKSDSLLESAKDSQKNFWLSWLGLFTSMGTILCCALPSLLVSLGLGASLAGFIGVFPQIVWLSENKIFVFIVSGICTFLSLLWTYTQRNAPCPVDENLRRACLVSRKWSWRLGMLALCFWGLGFLFAFVFPLWL